MVLTKELAAKGTAMLGSAGAGGTGIYYGGRYVSGLSGNAQQFLKHAEQDSQSYYTFTVQKADKDNDVVDLDDDSNPLSFTPDKTSFEVKVSASSMSNAGRVNTDGHQQNVSSAASVSCTFKFELETPDNSNKTIKQDY